MTVSSSTNKIIGSGNGVTTSWPFSFKVFDPGHLVVAYTDASGDETVLGSGDYVVSLNADQDASPGGTVTYSPAIASGTKLTLLRSVPFTQAVDLKNQGGFFPEVLERGFDLVVMQVQQLREQLARSLKLSPSQAAIGELEATDAARAGSYLGFDPAGNLGLYAGVAAQSVSLAMQPVVSAASLALARTAMGVASLGANTFTGAQTLPGNASNALEAVPKQQAESIALAAALAAAPVGACFDWPTDTPPANYLVRDGATISRTSYASLFAVLVTQPGFTSANFTVTIASPGLVTNNSHGYSGGERLRLSTTGALPTGLNATDDFFVIVNDANSYWLATSEANAAAGTKINTSGSQSGTHSRLRSLYGLGDGSTTFKLPDDRDLYSRGKPASGAAVGTYKRDAMHGHRHQLTMGANGGGAVTTYNALGTSDALAAGSPAGSPANSVTVDLPLSDGTNGTPSIANETRPVTRYALKIIKYQ